MGLLLTLVLGIFILIGALIVFITKNNDKFVEFSISLAFGVIVMLIFIDLIPEAYEIVNVGNQVVNILTIMGGTAFGFVLLSVLDKFIPDHDEECGHCHHHHHEKKNNLKHIGIVSSLALVIHNIIEGMAIYLLFSNSVRAGLVASIGVGLHNIPLGMVIASTFYKSNNNKNKTMLIMLTVSLSTFVGGLIIFLFPTASILEIIEPVSLIITLGMLLYIAIMELLPRVIHTKDKKNSFIGILLGILLLLITLFF